MQSSIALWYFLPKRFTTGLAAISNEVGHYLPGAPAQSDPEPTLVRSPAYKRPDFIKFQSIVFFGRLQRVFYRRLKAGFFLTIPLALDD